MSVTCLGHSNQHKSNNHKCKLDLLHNLNKTQANTTISTQFNLNSNIDMYACMNASKLITPGF